MRDGERRQLRGNRVTTFTAASIIIEDVGIDNGRAARLVWELWHGIAKTLLEPAFETSVANS
jgi:hypothetical protein